MSDHYEKTVYFVESVDFLNCLKMDKLIEIPRASLPELRDLFLVDWPKYVTANYTLDNYINWMEKDSSLQDFQILSSNGLWRDNGTFVVIVRIFIVKMFKLCI